MKTIGDCFIIKMAFIAGVICAQSLQGAVQMPAQVPEEVQPLPFEDEVAELPVAALPFDDEVVPELPFEDEMPEAAAGMAQSSTPKLLPPTFSASENTTSGNAGNVAGQPELSQKFDLPAYKTPLVGPKSVIAQPASKRTLISDLFTPLPPMPSLEPTAAGPDHPAPEPGQPEFEPAPWMNVADQPAFDILGESLATPNQPALELAQDKVTGEFQDDDEEDSDESDDPDLSSEDMDDFEPRVRPSNYYTRIEDIDLSVEPVDPTPGSYVRDETNSPPAPEMSPKQFNWKAPNFGYNNLAFEEPLLERHGYSRRPRIQPAISGVKFLANTVVAPLDYVLRRDYRCDNPLGWGTPGSYWSENCHQSARQTRLAKSAACRK